MDFHFLPIEYYANLIMTHHSIWPYLIIYVGMTLEGPFFTIATVVLAMHGVLYLPYVLVFSLFAEITSDYWWFILGRLAGPKIIRILGRFFKTFRVSPDHESRLEQVFANHPGKLLFAIKFSYGFSHIGLMIAGMSKMPTKTFIGWIALISIPWIAVLVALGVAVGSTLKALQFYSGIQFIFTTIILSLLAILLLRAILKKTQLLKRLGFTNGKKKN
jgi:membrane protein DedA with SNARE-associated domain